MASKQDCRNEGLVNFPCRGIGTAAEQEQGVVGIGNSCYHNISNSGCCNAKA